MFKPANSEDEIYRSMESALIKNQVDSYGTNKLARAVDLLNAAADIFEKAGMSETATNITEVLTSLAGALK